MAATAAATAQAPPLLWRVDGRHASWIYGTIHVTDARVVELPAEAAAALLAAKIVYVETPLDDAGLEAGLERMIDPDVDRPLGHRLPSTLYDRLDRYVKAQGATLAAFDRLQPWAIALQVTTLDRSDQPVAGANLDERVAALAVASGKKVAALETTDEQLDVFNGFTTAEHCALLDATLEVLEQLHATDRRSSEELVQLYLAGDPEKLREQAMHFLPQRPDLRQRVANELVTRRNLRLGNRIADQLLTVRSSHFFAIGAAHLGGPDGVLALLRAKGYTLTRVGMAATPLRAHRTGAP